MQGKAVSKENAKLDPTLIFDTVEFPDAYKISYLANAIIVPTYEDVLKAYGLLRTEYHLLMCLSHYPVLASTEVARLTRMPRNSISRAVKRMEKEGYVTRKQDPDDLRKSKLKATISGQKLHDQVAARFVKREAEILRALSSRERAQFQNMLSKLAVHAANLER